MSSQQALIAHLIELRERVTYALIAFLLAFGGIVVSDRMPRTISREAT